MNLENCWIIYFLVLPCLSSGSRFKYEYWWYLYCSDTTRKWFLWRVCVVYLFVRSSEGRGIRFDDISYIFRKFILHIFCFCKALGGTRVTTGKYLLRRICIDYLIAWTSVSRRLRLDDESCILGGNLRYVLTCKALGEERVTTRKCFLCRTCVVYLIVRPSVGRGLSLDDASYILMKLVLFTCL